MTAPFSTFHALAAFDTIRERVNGRRLAVFLDYDGTLTPIVGHPKDALLDPRMRVRLETLGAACPLGIISGRSLDDVAAMVGLGGIAYAGDHGFDMRMPDGRREVYEPVRAVLPQLDTAQARIEAALVDVAGAWVERKRFSMAVHYRAADPADVGRVEAAVRDALADSGGLKYGPGRKIFDVKPALEWDKGQALLGFLKRLGLDGPDTLAVYVGDDTTDEDAFAAIRDTGLGVLVAETPRVTSAHYLLRDPDEVGELLERLTELCRAG